VLRNKKSADCRRLGEILNNKSVTQPWKKSSEKRSQVNCRVALAFTGGRLEGGCDSPVRPAANAASFSARSADDPGPPRWLRMSPPRPGGTARDRCDEDCGG